MCVCAKVWESLVLEQGVKNRLLEYATTALLFTDKKVSKNVISWNRSVPSKAWLYARKIPQAEAGLPFCNFFPAIFFFFPSCLSFFWSKELYAQ